MRMIFVNLPVKDLPRSKAFFEALGFSINPQFTNDDAACVVIDENIFAMLLTEPFFKGFITGEIGDANAATEVLTCLSASSRAEVDDLLARAQKAGGRAYRPVQDLGFMYSCSFQDPDGHVWEIAYMDAEAMAQAAPQSETAAA